MAAFNIFHVPTQPIHPPHVLTKYSTYNNHLRPKSTQLILLFYIILINLQIHVCTSIFIITVNQYDYTAIKNSLNISIDHKKRI